jgi:putative tryptophan/tyrosine transport system substrate-binding protein
MPRTTVKLILTLALGILVAPLAVHAQPAGHLPRIGILGGNDTEVTFGAFRQSLHDLGYVEGQNILMEWRFTGGRPDLIPPFLAEFVRLKVDILVTGFSAATLAARDVTDTIPIVFASMVEPVEHGLVASLNRPGGNITGVANINIETLTWKPLEMLKEMVPEATLVAFLADLTYPVNKAGVKALQAATQALGMQLHVVPVHDLPNELEGAFAALARERIDVLCISGDPQFIAHRTQVVDLVTKSGLPAIYNDQRFVEVGGLLSYGPDDRERFRRVAVLVDKILRGAKPADIPVEQPTKYYLAINLKTAKALGLTIPPGLLVLADKVFQ